MKDDHASNQPDNHHGLPEADEIHPQAPFDFGSLIEAVVVHWRRVVVNSLLLLFLGLIAAVAIFRPTYTASVQLSRYEPPLASDSFRPQQLTTSALLGMISSSDALQKTGSKLTPPLSAEQLASRLKITEDHNSELIVIEATGKTRLGTVSLANLFCLEAVRSTQAIQKDEATEAGNLITQQLANSDADRATVTQQLAAIEILRATARQKEQALLLISNAPTAGKVDGAEITRLGEKTQTARDELADLQARYTDVHPLVREQKARLAALEAQLLVLSVKASKSNDAAAAAATRLPPETAQSSADQSTGYDALALRLNTLETSHAELIARQRVIELFATHPPGYMRVIHAATAEDVLARHNWLSIGVLALLCSALGLLGTVIFIAIRELFDDRLKTGADVKRVTRLPLLATLSDLDAMSPTNKSNWAFRTWTALQNKLSVSPNQGLVCGFTSSGPGEGRSTWIKLLSQSARQCGFTVLTISSSQAACENFGQNSPDEKEEVPRPPMWDASSLTTMVMANPTQLMEKLTVSNLSPSANLPLSSGWVWELDRRKQWQRALHSWRAIDNVVILVELPPMSDPETVLLAENMPNLIWLAESHKVEAAETLEQLETLRNARCHLVGAVLNREPASHSKRRLARWVSHRSSLLASIVGLISGPAVSAQVLSSAAPDPISAQAQQASFDVTDSAHRAPWQQRLTLGPGDLLNLSVFGQPELTQEQVPVGPDGRISYLEAQNVMANGLTIDEFRAALNSELGKFRSAPEVIVVPAEYNSKKYYVLGAVVKKGAFTLNRPITIIEAISQADGLETGVIDHNQVMLADLSRSFIARQGKHLPVDFEKLFLEGDLSQNIALEPDDYIYFPSGEQQQIYVLGEVRFPGPLTFNPHTSTLEAIAVRGGFSDRAWQTKLLVIRGSLDHPQTFIVNAADVLSAKTADFQLQPRDIVYVSSRPWLRAEDLLDDAATSFVQAAVITATGRWVDPIGGRH
jgi:protein involved in polysaccharide export with SLBB domain/capsular polysaccharide biosynthesis protein